MNSTSIPITTRVPTKVAILLEEARARQTRTRSLQVLYYVAEGLRRDGLLTDDDTGEGR